MYGNTKLIAKTISSVFPSTYKVKVLSVQKTIPDDLDNIEVLIVGSPTHGGNAKPTLQSFLKKIPLGKLNGVKVCSFDTRFKESNLNFPLKILVKTIGYAAPKIEKILKIYGGIPVIHPEGFFVKEKDGPLLDGELERAKNWAKDIHKQIS